MVLGEIGRNFAAGMSGGIAYLYDPSDVAQRRCNLATVTLEPLDGDDDDWVRGVLERFAAQTGSQVAGRLVARWRDERSSFVAVVPHGWRDAAGQPASLRDLVGARA